MAKAKKFKMVNMKFLTEQAGIPHQKVYDNIVLNKYNTLDFNERTLLSNTLVEGVRELFKEFGFAIQIKRLP
jgi:hypothetical protein